MEKSKNPVSKELAEVIIATGASLFHKDGELEIDTASGAPEECISTAETIEELIENGGAYVKAWVWVSNDSLPSKIKQKYGIKD
jgi:hypothetical protein